MRDIDNISGLTVICSEIGGPDHPIKPCPFCGCTKLILSTYPKTYYGVDDHKHKKGDSISCTGCNVSGPIGKNIKEAIQNWDARKTPVEFVDQLIEKEQDRVDSALAEIKALRQFKKAILENKKYD